MTTLHGCRQMKEETLEFHTETKADAAMSWRKLAFAAARSHSKMAYAVTLSWEKAFLDVVE